MTKRIHATGPTLKSVRDVGTSLPRVEAAHVQAALGAEATAQRIDELLAPITLFVLREELLKRLQSSGGRPGLSGATRRAKIPLSDREWFQLEELAVAVSYPGFAPSAGQVASVLLSLSIHSVAGRVARPPAGKSGLPRRARVGGTSSR